MSNKINKFLIMFSLLLILLVIIPSSFAIDEDFESNTTEPVAIESDDINVLEASGNDYYFDASVEKDGDGTINNPYKTLTANRIKANSNIHLANGEYTLDKRKEITNVNFIGSDADKTIIKYKGIGFNVQSSITLKNLTLYNLTINNNYKVSAFNTIFAEGNGVTADTYGNNYGGAIYTPYSQYYTTMVNVTNCTFINNHAEYGGALYIDTGNLYVTDCVFKNNSAFNYGGAIALEYDSKATVTKSKFINDYSQNDAGGAIYIKESNLNADTIEFTNCTATFGAGLTSLSSTVTLKSVKGRNNTAKYEGGAIYNMYGTFSISSSSFDNNSARNGGALFIDNSTSFTIITTSFTNNRAQFAAGAIYSLLNKLNRGTSVKDASLGNIFENNTAVFKDDEYEVDKVDLKIGNGNYTMYKVNETEITGLPSYFSLLDEGHVTSVKDQQTSGNCWAFTAIATLESCILKASGDNLDLSEEHLKNMIELYSDYGWAMDTNGGGYNEMPFGYLTSWLGPVLESDDLTDDQSTLSAVLDSMMHVQNIIFLERHDYTDNDEIKQALMKYGAVGTGIYYDAGYLHGNSYYYYGSSYANHAVTIVGWDDNYSVNNFYNPPKGNGAWIVKNSWNTDWGKDGYFYVSYYDTKFAEIGVSGESYTFILNDTIKLDKNYQYDIAGMTDYFYNSTSEVWYKNVFTATDNEFLAAVSTYFEKETNWDLSVYVNNVLETTKSGISHAGYFTFYLDKIIPLKIGDVFEVVFKISGQNEIGFPVSEKASLNKLVYDKNTSFVSYDGKNWKDLFNLKWSYSTHSYSSATACIKAFTIMDTLDTNMTLNISYDGYNPVNITATIIDHYGSLVNMGNVTFNFNGVDYVVNVTNGKAEITHIFDKTINNVTVTYNATNYKPSISTTTIEIGVLDVDFDVAIEQDLNNVIINIEANQKITDNVTIVINDKKYNITLVDGKANLTLDEVDLGKYDVEVSLDNTEIYNSTAEKNNFTVNVITTKIQSANLTTDDFSCEAYSIKLVNKSGEAIAGKNIKFTLNGETYDVLTDDEGIASIPINLDGGEYIITAEFGGDEDYVPAEAINEIKVKTKINVTLQTTQNINNVVIDIILNKAINETIDVKVNDENYTLLIKNGKSSLELNNLINDNYNVSATLENDNDYLFDTATASFNINVNELKIVAADLNTSDYSNEEYPITLVDMDNNPIAGKEVVFTLDGVTYIVKTDSNGIAFIKLNLKAGTYRVTAKFEGDNEYFPTNILNTIIVKDKVGIAISISKNSNNALINIKLSKSIDESLNVVINNRNYFVKSVNGRALINLDNMENGNYSVSASLVDGDKYISDVATNEFVINVNDLQIISKNITTIDYSNDIYSVALLDDDNNAISGKTITFILNSVNYVRTTDENGVASIAINLDAGEYDIQTIFNGDDDFFKNNATNKVTVKEGVLIKDISINHDTNDVSVEIKLTKEASENIDVLINGEKFSVTAEKGIGLLNVNLDNGDYNLSAILAKFNSTKNAAFTVDTPYVIESYDFATYYKSGSEYSVALINNNKGIGGKTIIFTLDGVAYNKTTDENGKAAINVNLPVGEYEVSIYNPENGQNITQTIQVIKTIINNKDLTKYYKGSQVYKVLVMGDNNKAVGAGETVVMKINGKSYKVKTNSKGYASLNVNLKPKKYTITATYKQFTVKNKVTIKTTIVTKNISKKKAKTAKFTAKLLNKNGKILKNKKVKFKFKGKTYSVKTNSKGIATLKIGKNLKVGKHVIYTSYGTLKIKNTITVKK